MDRPSRPAYAHRLAVLSVLRRDGGRGAGCGAGGAREGGLREGKGRREGSYKRGREREALEQKVCSRTRRGQERGQAREREL